MKNEESKQQQQQQQHTISPDDAKVATKHPTNVCLQQT